MDKTNNLPIEIKRNLPIEQKRNNKRTINGIKRIGKIALNTGIAISGAGLITIVGGPAASIVGTGLWMYGGINAGYNVLLNTQKDAMFTTGRNIRGELTLSQDSTNFQAFSKLKGLTPAEKAAVMGLEMFVGMQNLQQQYEDQNKKKIPARDSENNVYPQVFRTLTHGVNIKTIEALEKLGYLQIEKNEPIKRKSLLIFEKLGFKQYEEVKDILKAVLTFDEEKIKGHQKQINEMKFRLTDKPFDLDEIYKQFLQVKDTRGINPMRKPIRRIGILLDILKHKNIDIQTDELGMKKINYSAERPFAERVKSEIQSQDNGKSFRESLQIQNDIERPDNSQEINQQVAKEIKTNSDVDIER